MVFLFLPTLPLQTSSGLQRGVPTIFRLSFHTTKHSSILFSVREGTLILGNKTLSQREGSSAPTEDIIILILGLTTVIGSSHLYAPHYSPYFWL